MNTVEIYYKRLYAELFRPKIQRARSARVNRYDHQAEKALENARRDLKAMGCGPSSDSSDSKALNAAILIQNWYRRYRARLEARRRCTWMIYQSIEYSGEQDQLKLYNFFNDMMALTSGSDAENLITDALSNKHKYITPIDQPSLEEEDDELYRLTNYEGINVENSYRGPKLTFPLDSTQVKKMIDYLGGGGLLHVRYLLELLHETRKMLKTKPNINQASTSIARQITVCGDLHGKLDDLIIIFYKNGLPDVTNPYVFNGDFVDRGAYSIETAAVLFASFLVNPNVVFLNRGNHEDHIMNYRYGFIKEIQNKYKSHANKVVRLFGDLFSWLPLATVIDNSILVCHGGISDKTDLNKLAQLDRHKFLSALRPPVESSGSEVNSDEWKQILDILWSDPKPQNGCSPNTFRGGGSYFGPNVTTNVLARHNMNFLIRSHECKIEGFEYTHNDQVLTIFSASNYYEEGSNRGAYIKLDSNLDRHIVQYMATKNQKKASFQQRVSYVEESALRDLQSKILAHKTELVAEFENLDSSKSGYITVQEWCQVLENVTSLALPWRTLRPQLTKTNKAGKVDYMSSFNQAITNKYSETSGSITEQLYKNRDSLETIFRIMDKDNSGQISLAEFKEACTLLSKHTHRPLSEDTVEDMARSIDINKDGYIDFNEFLEAFRIVESGH